jgi:hypothetical protein
MVLLDTRNYETGNGLLILGELGAKNAPIVRVEGTARGWRLVSSLTLDEAIQFARNLKQWVS